MGIASYGASRKAESRVCKAICRVLSTFCSLPRVPLIGSSGQDKCSQNGMRTARAGQMLSWCLVHVPRLLLKPGN